MLRAPGHAGLHLTLARCVTPGIRGNKVDYREVQGGERE